MMFAVDIPGGEKQWEDQNGMDRWKDRDRLTKPLDRRISKRDLAGSWGGSRLGLVRLA